MPCPAWLTRGGARRQPTRKRLPQARELRLTVGAATSWHHPVDADHPVHHVTLDVTMVEPGSRRVLSPAELVALGRAHDLRVLDGSVRCAPAMAVDVEGVEVVAQRDDVPLHRLADLRSEDGRVADEGAPVDRHEPERRFEV